MVDAFWNTLGDLSFGSEEDVELRLLAPLAKALGWRQDQIHSKVRVEFFLGTKRGRPHEADLVLAEPEPMPPKRGYVVIEAKKPSESLDGAENQAFSYTYGLRAPFYVLSNGLHLELWQNGVFQDNHRIMRIEVPKLAEKRAELESTISPSSVTAFLEANDFGRVALGDVDLGEYINFLAEVVLNAAPVERAVWRDSTKQVLEAASILDIADTQPVFIQARGGRGKTQLLYQIASCCLRVRAGDGVRRIPILIPLAQGSAQLEQRIADVLKPLVPSLATAAAVNSWLRKVPTLLLLDDWHRLSTHDQASLEQDFLRLNSSLSSIVCTANESAHPPRVPGLARFSLNALSNREQEAFVESLQGTRHGDHFIRQAPKTLTSLLREPVFLAIYLGLFEQTGYGAVVPPANLAELLQRFLEEVVRPIGLSVDEIASLCQELNSQRNFDLSDIAGAIAKTGITIEPDTVSSQLKTIGLWEQIRPNRYGFAHEAWRIYFHILHLLANSRAEDRVLDWIRAVDIPELQLGAALIVGMVDSYEEQNRVLEELLERDLPSYFSALVGRVGTETDQRKAAQRMLEQTLWGRQQLVGRYFPAMRKLLNPWKYASKADDDKSLVVEGSLRNSRLSYYFGFSSDSSKEVVLGSLASPFDADRAYAPSKGCQSNVVNLELSGVRPDSGRLLQARDALDEIAKIVKNDELWEVEWFARELLISWVSNYANLLSMLGCEDDWCDVTVAEFKALVAANACEEVPASDYHPDAAAGEKVTLWRSVLIDNTPLDLEHAAAVAESLMERGLGPTKLGALGLPGPDLAHGYGGHFGSMYSPQRRFERVEALLTAVAVTYAAACEAYFSQQARDLMQYRGGPFRGVASVSPVQAAHQWGIVNSWEPCASWGESPSLRLESDRKILDEEEVMARYHELWQKWNRTPPPVEYSIEYFDGEWNATVPAVSNMVRSLLEDDIKRLKSMVATGR